MENKVVFGGGCFWCTEAIFKELEGVIAVKSGYSGGKIKNPTYREVCSGLTGHAEAIEVSYDAEKISLKDLLLIHMTTHDPTTLNRQGGDHGTQYRSVIFHSSEEEKALAAEVIQETQEFYLNPIVTEIAPLDVFYEAEDYHQNYYAQNSGAAYCSAVISPKLNKFRKMHAERLKKTAI